MANVEFHQAILHLMSLNKKGANTEVGFIMFLIEIMKMLKEGKQGLILIATFYILVDVFAFIH